MPKTTDTDPVSVIESWLDHAYKLGQADCSKHRRYMWHTHRAAAEQCILDAFEYVTAHDGRQAIAHRLAPSR